MNDFSNDIPKYKKKSQAKPPEKAKHKHVYEPCLIEYPEQWYLKDHVRELDDAGDVKTQLRFASYCPICGKTDSADYDRWTILVKKHTGTFSYFERVNTEEAERELNPATRTLPVFKTDGWCEKFVKIGEETK